MSRHRRSTVPARVAATLIAALAAFLIPSSVSAHAELDSITPADRSTVPGPPSSIVAVFTEQLDPAKSSLALVDPSGAVIAKGGTVDPNQTLTLTLDPATIAPGTYTVRWTSVSVEDGDVAHGTTTFTVAAQPSAPPSGAPSASAGAASATTGAPSVGPSPTASAAPTTPASSTSDALVPIVVALIVLAALGLWLLRGRARAGR